MPEAADGSVRPDRMTQNARLAADEMHPKRADLPGDDSVTEPAIWGT